MLCRDTPRGASGRTKASYDFERWRQPLGCRPRQIRNYGALVWFDPNPIAYVPADVPPGQCDFIGVVWHEVFHSIGFYAAAKEFQVLTTRVDGNDFFVGQTTQRVYGRPLPLAPRFEGWLQDHYGNTSLSGNRLPSGLMFQWGNYEGNRLDIGTLDLAILKDLGVMVTSTAGLPVVDRMDSQAPRNFISQATVSENVPLGTIIGTLTTTRESTGYRFELVAGAMNNGAFTMVGSTLRTKAPLDFETKNTYSILVRNTDPQGVWTATKLVVRVRDVLEIPRLVTPPFFAMRGGSGSLVGLQVTGDTGEVVRLTVVARTSDFESTMRDPAVRVTFMKIMGGSTTMTLVGTSSAISRNTQYIRFKGPDNALLTSIARSRNGQWVTVGQSNVPVRSITSRIIAARA